MSHTSLQIRPGSTAVQPAGTSPAYQAGRRAAINGGRIIANPFDSVLEAEAWRDWNIGFVDWLEFVTAESYIEAHELCSQESVRRQLYGDDGMEDKCGSHVAQRGRNKSGFAPENVIASFDDRGRHTDLVNEAIIHKPLPKAEHVATAVGANAPVERASLIAYANHESRAATAELTGRIRLSDAQTFNQFCIKYGWHELVLDCGDDGIPSIAAAELFHKSFGDLKTDQAETLAYLYKYAVTGGLDGIPAPAEWLTRVLDYIGRLNGASAIAGS